MTGRRFRTEARGRSKPLAQRSFLRVLGELPALLLAAPFLAVAGWAVVAAFTPTAALNRGEVGPITLENFRLAWASADFPRLYLNTILFTFGLLVVQLVTVTTAGFALAQLRDKAGNTLFYLVLAQLFLPASALILPNYLIVHRLGLADTLTALALP
ncbi:MAG: hypothetical protein P3W93_006990 [Thermus sp.]|nr:hypothetical protein [Thermus sp.]